MLAGRYLLYLIILILSLSKGDAALSATSSTPEPLRAWVVSGTVRLMPNSTAPPRANQNLSATVELAQNEAEPFQVAFRSTLPNGLIGVNIAAAAPAGSAGGLALSFEQVGYVYVEHIYPNSQGGAGWWPDPLLPPLSGERAVAPSNTTCSLWVTARSTATTAPGDYQVTVTLTALGRATDVTVNTFQVTCSILCTMCSRLQGARSILPSSITAL